MKRIPFALLLALGAGTGCAPLSPTVTLHPVVERDIPFFSGHPPVYLNVRDARPKKAFGALPSGAAVVSTEPLENVVRLRVVEGLRKAGFLIATLGGEDIPDLAIDVTRLNYAIERGATWSEIKVDGELKAIAKNGATTRTKTYKVESGKKWGLNPPSHGHERYLNAALSDLLDSLLTDDALLGFLATPASTPPK